MPPRDTPRWSLRKATNIGKLLQLQVVSGDKVICTMPASLNAGGKVNVEVEEIQDNGRLIVKAPALHAALVASVEFEQAQSAQIAYPLQFEGKNLDEMEAQDVLAEIDRLTAITDAAWTRFETLRAAALNPDETKP